jgi:hypothetical protein
MSVRSRGFRRACTPMGAETPLDSRGTVHQLRLVPKRAERIPMVARSAD